MSSPVAPEWPAVASNASVLTLMLGPATELARGGHHAEALRLLTAIGAEEAAIPAALDLLARIHAQQGRYPHAESLWARATERMPSNDTYQNALRHVRRVQRSRIARIYATPWFASGLGLIAAVAVVGLIGSVALRRPTSQPRHSPIAAPTSTEAVSAAPRITVDVPGIHQRIEEDEVVFIPESGLFASGSATLTVRAKALLSNLGHQLEPFADQLEIRVLGFTDDSPMIRNSRFRDNNALGMARAIAAYEYLTSSTNLPSVRFSVATGGQLGAPYAGNAAETRRGNRTVVLRVAKGR